MKLSAKQFEAIKFLFEVILTVLFHYCATSFPKNFGLINELKIIVSSDLFKFLITPHIMRLLFTIQTYT